MSWWWDRVVELGDQLVLPLHGGPSAAGEQTLAERAHLHASLRRTLEAGKRDGSIRPDVDTRDIVMFGVMLVALPSGVDNRRATARRLKAVHLDGLAARQPTVLEPWS